jgi:hypothetical protein
MAVVDLRLLMGTPIGWHRMHFARDWRVSRVSRETLLIEPPDRILRARPDSYIGLGPLERCRAQKRRFGVSAGLGMGIRSRTTPQAAEKDR